MFPFGFAIRALRRISRTIWRGIGKSTRRCSTGVGHCPNEPTNSSSRGTRRSNRETSERGRFEVRSPSHGEEVAARGEPNLVAGQRIYPISLEWDIGPDDAADIACTCLHASNSACSPAFHQQGPEGGPSRDSQDRTAPDRQRSLENPRTVFPLVTFHPRAHTFRAKVAEGGRIARIAAKYSVFVSETELEKFLKFPEFRSLFFSKVYTERTAFTGKHDRKDVCERVRSRVKYRETKIDLATYRESREFGGRLRNVVYLRYSVAKG